MVTPEAQATPVSLARPEAVSPLSAAAHPRPNRVCIRHPGYKSDPNNIILNLPAVDTYTYGDPAQTKKGLHHRTALTAGAIIANNAFDVAYLTHDQLGRKRVGAALDSILEPGDYWLQLGGEESQEPSSIPTDVDSSMAPPPRRRSTGTSSPSLQTRDPYPVVPSFRDWRFPHGRLPPDWSSLHEPPPSDPGIESRSTLPAVAAVPPPAAAPCCCVTALRTGVERCHLVPQAELLKEWFISNAMAQYASDPVRGIGDMANIAIMRSDIHSLFDSSRFAIVPKPSFNSSTSVSSSTSYALVVHVLNEGLDELVPLYHNVAIQSSSASLFSREFLFARFALSLFPLVQSFIDSPAPRRLAVSKLDNSENISRMDWMTGRQFAQHREQRGESRNGSKKRASSRISRDEQPDGETDCTGDYGHRRKRFIYGWDYYHMPDSDFNDEEDDRSGRLCNEQDRSAAAIAPLGSKGSEECTTWNDEQDCSHRWELEGEDGARGRPRYREREDSPVPPDPDGLPNLSCMSTSTGSERSSVAPLDPWTSENLGPRPDAPGDKTLRAGSDDAEDPSRRDVIVGLDNGVHL